jgi:hypothetical protein
MPAGKFVMDSVIRSDILDGSRPASRPAAGVTAFMSVFLAATAALAAASYAAVRLVDPYGEFHSGRFPTVVLDSRRHKLMTFKQYNTPPVTGLIMGSSRSMLIEPRLVDSEFGTRSFNFAVENGHTEDFLAIYRWALRQGAQPKLVIIGLDVVSLHDDEIPDQMFERIPELKEQVGASQAPGQWLGLEFLGSLLEAKHVFTFSYLKDTLQSLRMALERQQPATGFDPDGYENRGRLHRKPPPAQRALADISSDTAAYMKRIEGMSRTSAKRQEYLRLLVQSARARGARVVVWLTPVHPLLMQRMAAATNYPALVAITAAFGEALRDQYGIDFYNFHDSRRFGGTNQGWYDATHMDPDNMTRVVLTLAGRAR